MDKPAWTKVTSEEVNQRKVILKAPVRITQCTVNSHCFRLEVCYLSQWCLPAWACLDKSVGRREADRGATGVMVSTMKAHLHRQRGPAFLCDHMERTGRGEGHCSSCPRCLRSIYNMVLFQHRWQRAFGSTVMSLERLSARLELTCSLRKSGGFNGGHGWRQTTQCQVVARIWLTQQKHEIGKAALF